jgi:hypothetical protein
MDEIDNDGVQEPHQDLQDGGKDEPSNSICRNPNLVKCGGEAQHLEKWGFGVLWDSRLFRAR